MIIEYIHCHTLALILLEVGAVSIRYPLMDEYMYCFRKINALR